MFQIWSASWVNSSRVFLAASATAEGVSSHSLYHASPLVASLRLTETAAAYMLSAFSCPSSTFTKWSPSVASWGRGRGSREDVSQIFCLFSAAQSVFSVRWARRQRSSREAWPQTKKYRGCNVRSSRLPTRRRPNLCDVLYMNLGLSEIMMGNCWRYICHLKTDSDLNINQYIVNENLRVKVSLVVVSLMKL